MSEKKENISAQEKLDKIIKEKSEKNKILKKLLNEINKEIKNNGISDDSIKKEK